MARILVVGSVALDHVIRLTEPLRPGTHLEGFETQARLGGGGANVAVPLALAGHDVSLVGCVGNDAAGGRLTTELEQAGVATACLVRVAGPSTRSLVVVEPGGERTVINLHRCCEARPPVRLRRLPADIVYVRSRAGDLAPLLAEKARAALVVAHLPPSTRGSRPAQILIASEPDLAPNHRRRPWLLARRASGGLARWAVLTRGARGAVAFSDRGTIRIQAPRVRAIDTTGAGDAFAAGLVHALASGASMRAALKAAAAWGAACVTCDCSVLSSDMVRRLAGATPVRGGQIIQVPAASRRANARTRKKRR